MQSPTTVPPRVLSSPSVLTSPYDNTGQPYQHSPASAGRPKTVPYTAKRIASPQSVCTEDESLSSAMDTSHLEEKGLEQSVEAFLAFDKPHGANQVSSRSDTGSFLQQSQEERVKKKKRHRQRHRRGGRASRQVESEALLLRPEHLEVSTGAQHVGASVGPAQPKKQSSEKESEWYQRTGVGRGRGSGRGRDSGDVGRGSIGRGKRQGREGSGN